MATCTQHLRVEKHRKGCFHMLIKQVETEVQRSINEIWICAYKRLQKKLTFSMVVIDTASEYY